MNEILDGENPMFTWTCSYTISISAKGMFFHGLDMVSFFNTSPVTQFAALNIKSHTQRQILYTCTCIAVLLKIVIFIPLF